MTLLFEYSPFAPQLISSNSWWPGEHDWCQIRNYCDDDLYPCLALWAKASWRAHDFLGVWALLKQCWRLWRGQLKQATTWVYVQQGVVCGFIAIHPQHHIAGFFVDPDFQGCGIGRTLLKCVDEALGVDTVDVYSLNAAARDFYERHGFVVTDITQADADGEPYSLLRMTKLVEPS